MNDKKIEVELRAKANDSLKKKISDAPKSTQKEHDVYYKFPSEPENDWIARVRQSDDKYFLTYKSKKTFGEGAWNEVNIPIEKEKAEQLHLFFLENGYFIEVEIMKDRKTYYIEGMEVNIDDIDGLGVFIEAEVMTDQENVETAKEKIKSYFLSLGIGEEAITTKGYVGLMKDRNSGNSN